MSGIVGDQPVLVGLDRGDDVPHVHVAPPLELFEQEVADRGTVHDRPVERLVGDVEQPASVGAEAPAQRHPVRILRRRRVERSRGRRLPVDDELPLLVVVHPAPADVQRRAASSRSRACRSRARVPRPRTCAGASPPTHPLLPARPRRPPCRRRRRGRRAFARGARRPGRRMPARRPARDGSWGQATGAGTFRPARAVGMSMDRREFALAAAVAPFALRAIARRRSFGARHLRRRGAARRRRSRLVPCCALHRDPARPAVGRAGRRAGSRLPHGDGSRLDRRPARGAPRAPTDSSSRATPQRIPTAGTRSSPTRAGAASWSSMCCAASSSAGLRLPGWARHLTIDSRRPAALGRARHRRGARRGRRREAAPPCLDADARIPRARCRSCARRPNLDHLRCESRARRRRARAEGRPCAPARHLRRAALPTSRAATRERCTSRICAVAF